MSLSSPYTNLVQHGDRGDDEAHARQHPHREGGPGARVGFLLPCPQPRTHHATLDGLRHPHARPGRRRRAPSSTTRCGRCSASPPTGRRTSMRWRLPCASATCRPRAPTGRGSTSTASLPSRTESAWTTTSSTSCPSVRSAHWDTVSWCAPSSSTSSPFAPRPSTRSSSRPATGRAGDRAPSPSPAGRVSWAARSPVSSAVAGVTSSSSPRGARVRAASYRTTSSCGRRRPGPRRPARRAGGRG